MWISDPHSSGILSGTGQSYDAPSDIEVTLGDIGKIAPYMTATKHNRMQIMCTYLWMFCLY